MQPPHKDRLFELDRGDSSCPYSPRYLVHDQETFWAMNRGALRALTEDLGTSAQPTRKRHYNLLPRTSREAALASLCAAAAEVLRELLRLLARLGVDHDLPYRHPAVVAGVG